MKKIERYEAFDGKLFESEVKCREYEHDSCERYLDTLKEMANICHKSLCNKCIFNGDKHCLIASITEGVIPGGWTF